MLSPYPVVVFLFCLLLILPSAVSADELVERSLALRAALHQDPETASVLERLFNLYRAAGKQEELLSLYREHLDRYPEDRNAWIVHLRLLHRAGDAELNARLAEAVRRFPEDALIHYVRYEVLAESSGEEALLALEEAVRREKDPRRRRFRLEKLVALAGIHGRRDLVRPHIRDLAFTDPDAQSGITAARLFLDCGLWQDVVEVAEREAVPGSSPEAGIELALLAADAELRQGKSAEALLRLGNLLERLDPGYWRRGEILRRRTLLIPPGPERDAEETRLKAQVQTRGDAPAHGDLARWLVGLERPREARAVLEAGLETHPDDSGLERELLDLLLQLRDWEGLDAVLARLLERSPDRTDLAFRRMEALAQMEQSERIIPLFALCRERMDSGALKEACLEWAERFRNSQRFSAAIRLLELLRESEPGCFELRLRLAELYRETGRLEEGRRLFQPDPVPVVEADLALEIAGGLTDLGFLAEAERWTEAQAARFPANLDLQLQRVEIFRLQGERGRGEEIRDSARVLADSPERYGRWLRVALRLAEAGQREADWLRAEDERLAAEGRIPDARGRRERKAVFLEAAESFLETEWILERMEEEIAAAGDAAERADWRRRAIRVLDRGGEKDPRWQEQLRALADDDPGSSPEVNARLAVIHEKRKDTAQADRFLSATDPGRIQDPRLLRELENLYRVRGDGASLRRVLQRQVRLAPAEVNHWRRWITALAWTGDEGELRLALRGFLVRKETQADPQLRESLSGCLLDSYWREFMRKLAGDGLRPRENSLVELAGIERLGFRPGEMAWLHFARAFVLHALNRPAEEEEAIASFRRVAGEEDRVCFPDGGAVSASRAVELLRRPADAPGSLPAEPLPAFPLRVAWIFGRSGEEILHWEALPGGRLLVRECSGMIHVLNGGDGRCLWSRSGPADPAGKENPDHHQQLQFGSWSGMPPPRPRILPRGRRGQIIRAAVAPGDGVICRAGSAGVLLADKGEIQCFAADTGDILWQLRLPEGATPLLAVDGERVFAYHAGKRWVTCIDGKSGKRLWQAEPEAGAKVEPWMAARGEILADGGRLFLAGPLCGILDARDGSTDWRFDQPPERLLPPGQQVTVAPARPGIPDWIPLDAELRRVDVWLKSAAHELNLPVGLAAPAPAWHYRNGERRAFLSGHQLFLCRPSLSLSEDDADSGFSFELKLIDLRLPLAARCQVMKAPPDRVQGRWVFGRRNGSLFFLDAETGRERILPLTGVLGTIPGALVDLSLSGSTLYLSGPGGVEGYSLPDVRPLGAWSWPSPPAGELPTEWPEGTGEKGERLLGTGVRLDPGLIVVRCGDGRLAALGTAGVETGSAE